MPSIDRLLATRYTPTAPHPLTRWPWHNHDREQDPDKKEPLSERVRQHLDAADRARHQRRITRITAYSSLVTLLLCSELVALSWPRLSLRTAEWVTHKLGATLVVLAGLQSMRDGLLRSGEMSAVAGAVTLLLLILVAVGLGVVVWTSETTLGTLPTSHRPHMETGPGADRVGDSEVVFPRAPLTHGNREDT